MRPVPWWRRVSWRFALVVALLGVIAYAELFPRPLRDWKPYWWTFEQQPAFGASYRAVADEVTRLGPLQPDAGSVPGATRGVAGFTLWLTKRPLRVRYHFVQDSLRTVEFDAGYFFWPQGDLYLGRIQREIARRYGSPERVEQVDAPVHRTVRTWRVPRGEVELTLRRDGTDEWVAWVYQEDRAMDEDRRYE